jgi:hypothetical protein
MCPWREFNNQECHIRQQKEPMEQYSQSLGSTDALFDQFNSMAVTIWRSASQQTKFWITFPCNATIPVHRLRYWTVYTFLFVSSHLCHFLMKSIRRRR